MASATALGTKARRILVGAALFFSIAAPAMAADQVYIWRDASGTVQFSPVPAEEARSGASESKATASTDRTDTVVVAEAPAR